jgi:hypothetical protein
MGTAKLYAGRAKTAGRTTGRSVRCRRYGCVSVSASGGMRNSRIICRVRCHQLPARAHQRVSISSFEAMSGWSCGITTVWGRPLVPATTSIPVQSRQGNPQVLTDLACPFVGDFHMPRYRGCSWLVGFQKMEWLAPSRNSSQPCWRRCFSSAWRFIRPVPADLRG